MVAESFTGVSGWAAGSCVAGILIGVSGLATGSWVAGVWTGVSAGADGCFVKAYPAETTEAFLDGHVSAFAFLGGVPQSILYDNTKLAVARILGDGRRQRTRAFTELQSHYLFEDRFGRPGKGNGKGKVEGMVGYVRRNFLVPVPSFQIFEALNAHLEQRCLERMDAQLRGHTETIGQRMERDLESLLLLPTVSYDACDKQASRVSSLSLVEATWLRW